MFLNSNTISYIKSKKFWIYFITFFLFLAHTFLLLKNFSFVFESVKIGIPFFDSVSTIYDFSNSFTLFGFYVMLITLLLASLNMVLLFKYLELQNETQNNFNKNKNGKKMGLALTLAYIASHCASCGMALFGGLISVGFLSYLPFAGEEIGVLGLAIMLYVSYDIIKKLNNPYVCK